MRISDLSSDGCSPDLTRESEPAAQVQSVAIRELAQAVDVDLLEQRRGVRIDLVRIDPDIPRHRGLVVAHAGDQVQQPQRLFRSLLTRGVEFERRARHRSEEHTSELQSLMRISYAVFCLKKKTT